MDLMASMERQAIRRAFQRLMDRVQCRTEGLRWARCAQGARAVEAARLVDGWLKKEALAPAIPDRNGPQPFKRTPGGDKKV